MTRTLWFRPRTRRFDRLTALLIVAAMASANLALVVGSLVGTPPAVADTAPVDPTLPETVSAAALPTVQINGVVWAQVIVGNRVYATGQFTSARPAGAALGTNETPRSNILAYDLTTGDLITSWAPTLNAQGLAHHRVGRRQRRSTSRGDFDQVNGQWRSRIAAINAQTGALVAASTRARTRASTRSRLNGNTLYFGGYFTTVGATGFTPRSRLAAVDATTGALLPWAPTADREVDSMVVHPAERPGDRSAASSTAQRRDAARHGLARRDHGRASSRGPRTRSSRTTAVRRRSRR